MGDKCDKKLKMCMSHQKIIKSLYEYLNIVTSYCTFDSENKLKNLYKIR